MGNDLLYGIDIAAISQGNLWSGQTQIPQASQQSKVIVNTELENAAIQSNPNAPGAEGGSNVLGNIGLGVSIGQAIGAAYSAYNTGRTLKYTLKKQAEVMKINQAKMQLNTEQALRSGESQIAALTIKAGALKAKQKTAMAANGIQVGSGSSAEVLATTDAMKKLDIRTAQENALAAAWGYQSKADNYATQARNLQSAANYQGATAVSSAIGSSLEKIGAVADKWYTYSRS